MPDLTLDSALVALHMGLGRSELDRFYYEASDGLRRAPVEALNDLVREASCPCTNSDCDERVYPWNEVQPDCDARLPCCSIDCAEKVEEEQAEYRREEAEERTLNAHMWDMGVHW
jgi:hypothetical protein